MQNQANQPSMKFKSRVRNFASGTTTFHDWNCRFVGITVIAITIITLFEFEQNNLI